MGYFIDAIVLGGLVLWFILFVNSKRFGKTPPKDAYASSPNCKDGKFCNIEETSVMKKGGSFFRTLWKFLTHRKNLAPASTLPSMKTDLKNLNYDSPAIIWFGHSSYLITLKKFNILVDPVLDGNASPVFFLGKPFMGTDVFKSSDMPDIDMLILTHDHFDHLEYKTIKHLHHRSKHIYTSLGVKYHLIRWGIPENKITEFDWNDSHEVPNNISEKITLTALTSRHFSGRRFRRNVSLWSAFILELGACKVFIGADSGYGKHFKEIGEKHGPFELAMLECGQYDNDWPIVHMTPEEAYQAALDIKTEILLPDHWGKFALALHPWDEPMQRLFAAHKLNKFRITTPLIGEPVVLNKELPIKKWWEQI